MRRDDLDFPAILRSDDDMTGLQAYLDEQRQRREAAAQPAVGPGVQLAIAFIMAFFVMLAVAFIVEVLP